MVMMIDMIRVDHQLDDKVNDDDKGNTGDAVSGDHGGGSLKPQRSVPGRSFQDFQYFQCHHHHQHSYHRHHHFIRPYQAREHPPLTPQLPPWLWFTRWGMTY